MSSISTLALAALFLAAPAAGSPDGGDLTLQGALQLAQLRNERPAIAKARVDRARALRKEAFYNLAPSLTTNASYTRRAFEVRRTIGDAEVVLQKYDALGANAQLQWDVFDARAFAGISAAGHGLEAQKLEATEIARTLAFEVAESYYAVLSAERLRDAADKRLHAASETAADAKSRVEAGLAARNEATRTELELATARLARQEAKTTVDKARLALGYLIAEPIPARALVEPPASPQARDLATLEASALESRQDLKALAERTEQARALAQEPWLRLLPTLGLRGEVRGTNEAGLNGRNFDGNVAATLSWILFDGGIRYAQAEQLAAVLEEAELAQRAAERSVGLDLQNALADLANAEASVEQAEVRAQVALTNAEEVRDLFQSGLASALQQVDAAVAEFEATAELARQRVRHRVAELSLVRAIGAWPAGEAPPAKEVP